MSKNHEELIGTIPKKQRSQKSKKPKSTSLFDFDELIGKPTKRINVRAKGHGFERWVAKQLEDIFPDAERHLEFQKSEAKGFDLKNTGELRIQCKRNRKYASIIKIEEVVDTGNIIPVLVTKGDNKEPIACVYLKDFIKFLKRYYGK